MSEPKRTPEEQQVIDVVARRRGREFAEKNAELALDQARSIGVLAEGDDDEPRPDVVALGDGDYGEESKTPKGGAP